MFILNLMFLTCDHCLSPCYCTPLRRLAPSSSFPPIRSLFLHMDKISLSPLFCMPNSPRSPSLSSYARCFPVPESFLWRFSGLTPVNPRLSWAGEMSGGSSEMAQKGQVRWTQAWNCLRSLRTEDLGLIVDNLIGLINCCEHTIQDPSEQRPYQNYMTNVILLPNLVESVYTGTEIWLRQLQCVQLNHKLS